jgi:hypothetical protein
MIHKLKRTLLLITAMFTMAAPLAFAASVSAATQTQSLCSGGNLDLTGTNNDCTGVGGTGDTLTTKIASVINVISIVVAAVAVIMLMIGGFRYVTSGGKQESVAGAKNTIIYAIVGLVIVALAQVIVQFVLNRTTG